MKKYLLASTLLAAAMAVPAFADGDGSQGSPYSGEIKDLDLSGFESGSTVYIDGWSSGYWANKNMTVVANINIGSGGISLTDGYSDKIYTFAGAITGSGNWTFTGASGGTPTQHYIFTGDVSGYSGTFSMTAGGSSGSEGYLQFGNGGQAATNTNVSGTGSITEATTGSGFAVIYNYGSLASGTETAITIGNTSITTPDLQFTGSVDYIVSSALIGTGSNAKLTISNTGYTTTLNGTVSGINVTVSSGATLAVGESGSLNLSGATVDLASTIQNSGTVTIDTSTVFVLDNLTYTGSLDTGATFTLITGSSGSVTISGDLGISNVSSAHEIESATFNYTNGVLTVTVIESSDGLHGDGTIDSPYYTSGSGTIEIPVSGDSSIFTGKGTTVYLATDEKSLGNASENVYWTGGDFTAECNIVIGAAGIYLTNGNSGNKHIFTGAISGTGDWTVGYTSSSSGVNQDYCFTGDLSGWSGDFSITTSSTSDYVCYGDGKTVAATDTNVTGTGAVSVATGTIAFDYIKQDESGNTGPSTITIGNKSLTATTLEFMGDVAYALDLTKTTVSTTTLTVGENAALLITGSGTLTDNGSSSSIAVAGTLELADSVTLTINKNITASASIENLVLGNGSTVDLHIGAASSTSSKATSIGTLTIASSDTGASSATITTDNWEEHVTIGAIVGSGTLVLDVNGTQDHVTVYELTGTGTSSFTGTIDLTSTNSSTSAARGISLVISDASAAAGAVIDMGTEVSYSSAIALGVNAERVEIAGLVSTSTTGGDIVYSGAVTAGAQLGNAGATLIDYKNQGSYGSGSNFDNVGTTRNTLVINVADNATYSFSGVFMDMLNLEKTGAGTQSIEFKYSTYGSSGFYFDGSIAVKEGTLNLSGVAIDSSGITVDSGATLSIGNTITLAAESSSTISGTVTLGESGTLSVGTDATLTLDTTLGTTQDGTVEFSEGATLILSDAFLASAAEQESMAIIMANSITYNGESLTDSIEAFLEDCIDFDDDKFDVTFSYSGGVLSAEVTYVPEPELFSVFLGISALGMMATRRRRRKVA